MSMPLVAGCIAADGPLRIVAFGSSTTEGIGATSPASAYPARLAAELGAVLPHCAVEVLNRGIGGEDAEDMARRLPDILALEAQLVIWQTGSNDVLHDLPLDRFLALTRQGTLAMLAAGSDRMLMELQYCPALEAVPGSLRYRDAVRRVAVETGSSLLRRYDLMHGWAEDGTLPVDQMIIEDGLHMTDAAYARLAAVIARQILEESSAA